MAGEAEEILIRIALTGQDDVVAQLGKIGEEGVSAFNRLTEAIGHGAEVFGGLAAVFAGTGAGMFAWTKHTSEAVHAMGDLAAQAGMTIGEMSALENAMAASGASSDRLSYGFRRLAFTIQSEWGQIVRASQESANKLVDSQLKVEGATLSAQGAREKLFQTEKKLYEQGNIPGMARPIEDPLHAQTVAYHELAEAKLAVAKADQAEKEATEAAEKTRRNDINNVRAAVESVVHGQKDLAEANKGADLTYANVIKGLVAEASPVNDQLKDFHGNIGDIIDQAPEVKKVFYDLADFMKNSRNETLNSTLVLRLFGRGMGQDFVEFMKQGSAAIQENEKRLTNLGLVLSDEDKNGAAAFIKQYHMLSGELYTTVQQIGTFLGVSFTEGFKKVRIAFEENHDYIIGKAREMVSAVAPIISGFFTLLSGGTLKGTQQEWMEHIANGIKSIVALIIDATKAFGAFFIGVTGGDQGAVADKWLKQWVAFGQGTREAISWVIDKLKELWGVAEDGVRKFNEIFGTSFTAGGVIAGAAILHVIGVFGLLSTALTGITGVARLAWAAIAGGETAGAVAGITGAAGALAGVAKGAGGAAGGGGLIQAGQTVVRGVGGQFRALTMAEQMAGDAASLAVGLSSGAAAAGAFAKAFIGGLALIGTGLAIGAGLEITGELIAQQIWEGLSKWWEKQKLPAPTVDDPVQKPRTGDESLDKQIMRERETERLEGAAMDYSQPEEKQKEAIANLDAWNKATLAEQNDILQTRYELAHLSSATKEQAKAAGLTNEAFVKLAHEAKMTAEAFAAARKNRGDREETGEEYPPGSPLNPLKGRKKGEIADKAKSDELDRMMEDERNRRFAPGGYSPRTWVPSAGSKPAVPGVDYYPDDKGKPAVPGVDYYPAAPGKPAVPGLDYYPGTRIPRPEAPRPKEPGGWDLDRPLPMPKKKKYGDAGDLLLKLGQLLQEEETLQEGGPIHGPGPRGVDGVHIVAAPGEFVMSEPAVSKYGEHFMHAINKGHFALGGLIKYLAAGGPTGPDTYDISKYQKQIDQGLLTAYDARKLAQQDAYDERQKAYQDLQKRYANQAYQPRYVPRSEIYASRSDIYGALGGLVGQLPHFNLGGMVEGLGRVVFPNAPHMQVGGAVPSASSGASSLHPFNLVIEGHTFSGLQAPENTANQMSRFAVERNLRSGGKKPSWYK